MNCLFCFFYFLHLFICFSLSIVKFEKNGLRFFILVFFWILWGVDGQIQVESIYSFDSFVDRVNGLTETLNFIQTQSFVWDWVLVLVDSNRLIVMDNCILVVTDFNLLVTLVFVGYWFLSQDYRLNTLLYLLWNLCIKTLEITQDLLQLVFSIGQLSSPSFGNRFTSF